MSAQKKCLYEIFTKKGQQEMKMFFADLAKNTQKRNEFLVETGMYTKTGRLKKEFQ